MNRSDALEIRRFDAQVRFTFLVLVFCMFMLAVHPGQKKANEALYVSIITGLVGYWLPSPGVKKESQVNIDSNETNVLAQDVNQK